ncbi:MAG: Asp-tRNA(Asn)/Glu-tRNA(Gln) amidotransferase subunit GatC [Candidatus Omnitrophica bacterium]|nr:Asp-tRNA(Asn)/Glu-tRNA(Gln) amidotransferase subunit GatC [Candidatus Omnitrophota bacterium]MCA9416718.1 Asp-tRNA(Asn)/Glu-tRNA(Gln) amidotransferase subunit GatC [Candidatus Omnitrophota bacterium]MCA9424134.1 Asp-tRNA(Asn)/Glu-tRNA(Gln) amidotransferase subunit GatC [Candidatus Omnitrophota bacterium]MCA9430828.1 Asp-tRNA(Asn)/Glu-tRNA(Gln) amidotransferase subunit GatC [Candidatus Omnitrophota bacterium]MCA9435144.1 Asp-tRNA(Asn)/Glu-tRNA(Gln) amidotransferase subunit GatC [Candidatus Om
MSVTREEVKHIALLSRLELTEEEMDRYAEQLSAILDYAAKLNELDTAGVEPLFHAVPVENVFRPDVPGKPIPLESALQNSARTKDAFFEVPKVADGS